MIGNIRSSLFRLSGLSEKVEHQASSEVNAHRSMRLHNSMQPKLITLLVGMSLFASSGVAMASAVPTLSLDSDSSSGAAPGSGNYELSYDEQSSSANGHLADVGDVLITDADDTIIESASFVSVTPLAAHEFLYIASNYITANETGTTNQGISFTVSADRRTINLTGSFTLADYQDALDDFKYYNGSNNPDLTPRIFEFSVNDGDTDSNLARTTLTIVPLPDAPVAAADEFIVASGVPVNVAPLANDVDPDGTIPDIIEIIDTDGTIYSLTVGQPQTLLSGTQLTLLGDGTLDIERALATYGTETFSYVISDGSVTDQASIELDSDVDGDGVSDTLDIDDDNDGIPDSVEGVWDGTTQLFGTGGFDPADVLNFNPTTSVDGSTRYQVNVDIEGWGNVGTPDWTEGQYAVASSGSSHSFYPAIVDAPAPGTGFAIFSVSNEEFFKTVTAIPGETYEMSVYIGTLPVYDKNTLAIQSYTPEIDITVLGGTKPDGSVASLDESDLGQYTNADFPAVISSTDPGGYTQLNPHWEVVTMTVVANQPTMYFKIKSLNTNSVVVLDDIGLNLTSTPASIVDTDSDGRPDFLDIDSDDDGVLDNIEAQATSVYVAPSGVGPAMTDATLNGLDDNYEVAAGTAGFLATGQGLEPVNSDSGATTPDTVPDYIDLDSDNDTITDNAENGLAVAMPASADSDSDFDGLKDAYEAAIDGAANDGYVTNEGINNPLATGSGYLPDEDADAAAGTPLTSDLDYRDEPTPVSPPVATNDSASIISGSVASIDLSDNVSDVNGDLDITTIDLDTTTAGVQSTVTTASGSWSVDALGTVTFTPSAGFIGTATIAYTVSDTAGNVSAAADISVTVSAPPSVAPVATNDSASVPADTNATVDLNNNVSDADGDLDIATIDVDTSTAGIQATFTTTDGVWTVNATGVVTFNPVASFQGTSNLSYVVSDTAGNVSNVAVVSVVVAGALPVATNDSASVASGTAASIDLSNNVSDANNDVDIATIDLDTATTGVQSTLSTSDGVWSVDAAGLVTFTPATNYAGTATLPYVVSDANGNVSSPATLSVTVAVPPSVAPVATNDSANVAADTNATIDLSNNISDADGDLDIATIDIDTTTAGVQTTLTTADGTWSVNATGMVTFNPTVSFQGTSNLSYVVSDTAGNVSNVAVVSVVVAGADPVATNDSASVASGTAASIDLSDNVSDANNDVDITSIDLDPSTTGVQSALSTSDGVWSVNALGMVTFTPAAGFTGTATIPYTVSDLNANVSANATISVTVAAAGTGAAPVATNDSVSVAGGAVALIDLSDNITDVNGNEDLTTIDLDPATPGVQSTLAVAEGVWSVDTAGMVTFTPATGFSGTATIPYTVSDANGNESALADISVVVAGLAPVADADVASTVQDTEITVDVLAGDTDVNGDIDSATLDLDPTSSGVQPTRFVSGEGFYSVVSGQVVFDPDPDFYGISNLDYVVSDAAGNLSNLASITITVQVDTDADGVADAVDLDDDNDGLPDLVEGTGDSDSDGVIDSLDLDSDNDGLTDASEAGGIDEDADGIIDGFADTNNDGIDDATAASPLADPDTDADGIVDHLDVDSDNDGIPDVTEAGGNDIDGDGIVDGFVDTNADGLDDATAVNPLSDPDSDGDNIVDHLDLDSDNDGIPDITEAGGTDADGDSLVDGFTDADSNGLDDAIAVAPLTLDDTDGDGAPDYLDLDSDNDGLTDALEAGPDPTQPTDTDGDGIPDCLEVDSDYDGIPDSVEAGNSPATPLDSDADGTPDYQELDSDNDGKPDSVEAGVNPFAPVDSDGNNVPDYQEPDNTASNPAPTPNPGPSPTPTAGPVNPDSDGDGITDAVEGSADSDGDGIPNYLDIDSDNDGLLDNNEAVNLSQPIDTDGDGIVDYLDLDSDNDGLTDTQEAGGADADGNGIVDNFTDANGNGHDDGVGIAPLADPDSDGDGIVDHLDIDSDNDGLPDIHETLGSTHDLDGDGRVDNMVDTNADGLADGINVNGVLDTDSDGKPNHLDLDSDGDSLMDIAEIGGNDTDGDGQVDNWLDTNGNGIPDSVDVGITGGADADNDGIVDYADVDFVSMPDSDGDGIVDPFDDDHTGTGFVPIVSGETLTGNTLLDTNANGVPDVLEINSEAALQTEPKILSGLSGGGCSVSTGGTAKDPMLLLLLLAAGGLLVRRRRL